MTSQLLILGNGFDLHCGLKSSYKDFFRQEILDTTTENFDIIQLKPGVTGFWENLLLEYHKKYGDVDYKWCDIETIIKDTLWFINFGKISVSKDVINSMWKIAIYCSESIVDFDDVIHKLYVPTTKFIFTYCVNFFVDLAKRKRECSDQEKLHLLTERLLVELHYFEERFCKYIRNNIMNPNNEKGINEEYIVNSLNLIAKLTKFSEWKSFEKDDIVSKEEKQICRQTSSIQRVYEWQTVNVPSKEITKLRNVHILSFNYTALFDILGVESPCLYSNVHGKLCNEQCREFCNSSSIIFGVDDSLIQAQTENDDLKLFSKTYRKMFNLNSPASVLPLNDAPVDIKFYGHSLSKADYSYFQSIFDYYNLYSNNSVKLYFYYSENYNPTDAVYRMINSYGQSLTNKDQGKNLMHKLLLENRINIVKI